MTTQNEELADFELTALMFPSETMKSIHKSQIIIPKHIYNKSYMYISKHFNPFTIRAD